MTRPRTPQPDPLNDNMAHSHPAKSPPPSKDIPKGEFIDVASNQPVDPARLQVFQMPQQFLDWVLASDPPHLDPDDLRDTAPHGLRVERNKPVPVPVPSVVVNEPEFEATPVTGVPQLRISESTAASSSAPATVHVQSEEENATVAMRARRPVSPLSRWALTGKTPKRIKLAFALVLAALILILAWNHVDTGTGLPGATVESAATPVATVPSIEPPVTANPKATSMNTPAQVVPEPSRTPATSAASQQIGNLTKRSDSEPGAATKARRPGAIVQSDQVNSSKPVAAERKPRESATPVPQASTDSVPAKKAWFPEE